MATPALKLNATMAVISVTLDWRLGPGRTGAFLETNLEVLSPNPQGTSCKQVLIAPVLRGTWLWLLFCGVGLQGSGMSLAMGQSLLVFLGSSLLTRHLGTMGVPSRYSEQDQRI